VDGAYSLEVAGNAAFGGAVGSGTPLSSLDVTGKTAMNAGTVTTTGVQIYDGAVTLMGNTTLTATATTSYVVFDDAVDGAYSLTVNGTAGFGGAVGSGTPLSSLDVNGTTVMDAGTVKTGGGQTYNGIVTLYSNTALTDTGPGVTFSSTVDSATATPQVPYSLTVNGNAAFNGLVGSMEPLSSLDVTGTTAMDAGTVTTSGSQTYNGAVTLMANTTLTPTSYVVFYSTVDGGYSLTVNGVAGFGGAVGSGTPLSSLDVTGTTEMYAGTVKTSAGQTYNGSVELYSNTTLTGPGPGVTFDSAVNGGYSLTVNGHAVFGGAVGSTTPLSSLDVTGTTAMNAGTVTTSGDQTYNGAVTLGANTLLTATGAVVTFDSTVDGGYLMEVNGNAAFGGAVGNLTPLSALQVTGTTAMDAGTVTTTGVQIYNGAVTLSLDTILATDGASTHDLLFGSSINGAHSLTLDAGAFGDILVEGAIGATNALTRLTIADSNGATFAGPVSAGTIALMNTTGDITFGGDVTATSLITAARPYVIVFDGDYNIVTNPVTFLNTGGVIGGAMLFGSLTTAIPDMAAQPPQWHAPTSYPESLALSEADLEALRNLGVRVRSLTPGEVGGLLLDNLLLAADLPDKANPAPSDFTVAINRLPYKETQNLLAQYRDIFWKGGRYQAEAICASFEQAVTDYRKLGTKFTPGNFAEYVLGRNSDAYRYGAGIKSLLSALGSLGLTRRDFGAAKEVLLNRVKPAGLTTVDFARVIEGL
jgi:hypothetical protein